MANMLMIKFAVTVQQFCEGRIGEFAGHKNRYCNIPYENTGENRENVLTQQRLV